MANDDVSPLEAYLGYWLRRCSNYVSHACSRKLAALDVTVAEWGVLHELFDEHSLVPSALADRLGMTRGAISKLVDRLVAKGFMIRAASADDRRFQSLMLTLAGHTLVPMLASLADLNDAEFFGHLDPAERARLAEMMRGIVGRHALQAAPVD